MLSGAVVVIAASVGTRESNSLCSLAEQLEGGGESAEEWAMWTTELPRDSLAALLRSRVRLADRLCQAALEK